MAPNAPSGLPTWLLGKEATRNIKDKVLKAMVEGPSSLNKSNEGNGTQRFI